MSIYGTVAWESVLGDGLGADHIDWTRISFDSLASEASRRFGGDETDLETMLRHMEIILNEPDMRNCWSPFRTWHVGSDAFDAWK